MTISLENLTLKERQLNQTLDKIQADKRHLVKLEEEAINHSQEALSYLNQMLNYLPISPRDAEEIFQHIDNLQQLAYQVEGEISERQEELHHQEWKLENDLDDIRYEKRRQQNL